MRHLKDQIRNLSCLQRGSSEENGHYHKYLKTMLVSTKQQIDKTASQLITALVNTFHGHPPNFNDDDCSSSENECSKSVKTSAYSPQYCSNLVSAAIHVVQPILGSHARLQIGRMLLKLHSYVKKICQTQHSVYLLSSAHWFDYYSHKTLYSGQSVYRRSNLMPVCGKTRFDRNCSCRSTTYSFPLHTQTVIPPSSVIRRQRAG